MCSGLPDGEYNSGMPLSNKQKKFLRRLAHDRKPVVMIAAAGLSDTVMTELDQALSHHELIKVNVRVGDRDDRDQIIADACNRCGADLIQRIGNIATFYRPAAEIPMIILPSA